MKTALFLTCFYIYSYFSKYIFPQNFSVILLFIIENSEKTTKNKKVQHEQSQKYWYRKITWNLLHWFCNVNYEHISHIYMSYLMSTLHMDQNVQELT